PLGPVAVIVNYASPTLSMVTLPGGVPVATLDLSGVFGASNTTPFPYAVGVDPFLHPPIVAFSTSNLGVLVNLNPDTASTCLPLSPGASTCLPLSPGASPATPNVCVIGFVTLSTGASPQIAFEPLGHIAYVTPGGTGILE